MYRRMLGTPSSSSLRGQSGWKTPPGWSNIPRLRLTLHGTLGPPSREGCRAAHAAPSWPASQPGQHGAAASPYLGCSSPALPHPPGKISLAASLAPSLGSGLASRASPASLAAATAASAAPGVFSGKLSTAAIAADRAEQEVTLQPGSRPSKAGWAWRERQQQKRRQRRPCCSCCALGIFAQVETCWVHPFSRQSFCSKLAAAWPPTNLACWSAGNAESRVEVANAH